VLRLVELDERSASLVGLAVLVRLALVATLLLLQLLVAPVKLLVPCGQLIVERLELLLEALRVL